MSTLPVGVVGGTGYVSGELLRLIAGHPSLELHAISSNSSAGDPVEASFPNLSGCLGGARFCAAHSVDGENRQNPVADKGQRLAAFGLNRASGAVEEPVEHCDVVGAA